MKVIEEPCTTNDDPTHAKVVFHPWTIVLISHSLTDDLLVVVLVHHDQLFFNFEKDQLLHIYSLLGETSMHENIELDGEVPVPDSASLGAATEWSCAGRTILP